MSNHKKNSDKKALTIAITVLVFTITAIAIYNKKPSEIKYTRTLMGTIIEITLVGDDEVRLNRAAEAAFDEIKRFENIMSYYKKDSDVDRINASAGKKAAAISNETLEVIETSLNVSRITNGAFDITMGVLGKVWHFTKDDKGELTTPSTKEVKRLLPLIDFHSIIVDKKNSTVKLAKQGMKINLGGIAKGYIIGRAAEVLKKLGIKRGIIHAGGDMAMFNEPASAPWLIGIQDPRNKDKIIGAVKVSNKAVSTSGDYERFFIKDGKRYHHIMDPATGFPANKSMAVTIVADDPTTADALSTAVFIMGPDKGMKLIQELPVVEGLIIGADGKVTISSGLKGKVDIFEKQN
ncbi:MAG: FAD:protein FMN transferase [Deltaproteobacteria bacterium]|nr:FAD:protein FMN transferase [Deltaproteobacteria bacterium]